MTWTDDDLMAFADHQLDGERRAALVQALAADPALQRRVDQLTRERQRVAAAFADALDEPVPDRLTALLGARAPATPATSAAPPATTPAVVSLAAERERRSAPRPAGLSWAQWGGMAASVVLGVLVGLQLARREALSSDALLAELDGRVVAAQPLAAVLNTQVGGGSTQGVAVPVSFVAKDGRYCRAFSTAHLAGLACRDAAQWTVQTTVATDATAPHTDGLRQAATALPTAVLTAVDDQIAGEAMTAEQERQARLKGWQR